jgi:hypothetical protein
MGKVEAKVAGRGLASHSEMIMEQQRFIGPNPYRDREFSDHQIIRSLADRK